MRTEAGAMRHRYGALVVAALLVSGTALPSPAGAEVRVFACEPEWASLARAVGGAAVDAYSATHARQDPHHIRARPSLIAQIRRADMLFCSGADLEVGWLPILLRRGAGVAVQPGRPGHLMAADHVRLLEKPEVLDRSLGDIHPDGNPHVHLDPNNVLALARVFGERLAATDPGGADAARAGLAEFERRWREALSGWNSRARRLAGMTVVVHHRSWSYLIDWIGLRQVATLEPKPGLPPTATHLEAVLRDVRSAGARAVLRTPYDPSDASAWLSEKAGIPALVLPFTVDPERGPRDLFELFEAILSALEGVHDRR
ncbi:MAG: zinc ABC transporter substrate-binding protein [Rhodospirillaceae bacterium]